MTLSPMPNADNELDALIHLLDDPSPEVQQAVHSRLGELGRDVLPHLHLAQNNAAEPLRTRIAEASHDLHVSLVVQAWASLMDQPAPDLERGAFLLALYRFPNLDIPAYRAQLDDFAEQVRPRVRKVEGFERSETLTRFMFGELGFLGNHEEYYDPDNSYLNRVIDRRRGIPIGLSVVYLLLAKRLGLPIFGVNMPVHFVVKYEDAQSEIFLDVFNGGIPFTKEAGVRSLRKAGIPPHAQYFDAARPTDILLRMVRNLVHIAREAQQQQTLTELLQLLDPWDQNEA